MRADKPFCRTARPRINNNGSWKTQTSCNGHYAGAAVWKVKSTKRVASFVASARKRAMSPLVGFFLRVRHRLHKRCLMHSQRTRILALNCSTNARQRIGKQHVADMQLRSRVCIGSTFVPGQRCTSGRRVCRFGTFRESIERLFKARSVCYVETASTLIYL